MKLQFCKLIGCWINCVTSLSRIASDMSNILLKGKTSVVNPYFYERSLSNGVFVYCSQIM